MARKINRDKFINDFMFFDDENNSLNKYLTRSKVSQQEKEEVFLRILEEYIEYSANLKKKEKLN